MTCICEKEKDWAWPRSPWVAEDLSFAIAHRWLSKAEHFQPCRLAGQIEVTRN